MGFVVIDACRRIVSINQRAAAWLGLDPTADLQRSIDSVAEPEGQVLQKACSAPEEVSDFPVEFSGPGRSTVSLHARVLRQTGQRPSLVLLLNEAEPANQLDSQLARLDRLVTLGTCSAGIAHELRNALVSTKTFVGVLLEKDPGHELANIVSREILHIEGLLGQMLRHASPERPHLRPLSIHEILDHSLLLVRHPMRARSVHLKQNYLARPDLVQGDAGQLQQVFVNLLMNATESMEGGGQLTIRTAGAGSKVQVAFEDTGPGISPNHLEHLFEPFFTTKPEGSGLGLAISRGIVERHGGAIRAGNRAGGGAVFTVDLPVLTVGF